MIEKLDALAGSKERKEHEDYYKQIERLGTLFSHARSVVLSEPEYADQCHRTRQLAAADRKYYFNDAACGVCFVADR